jgi:molecular chaperone GrpE
VSEDDDAQDDGSAHPSPEAADVKQPGEEPVATPEPIAPGVTTVAGPTFEQRALLAEARLTEVLGAYRKLKGDQETFRDRTARNAERRFTQQHERLLLHFIEVLDNFDRALEAAEQTYTDEPLIQGLILVRSQLLQILKQEGLERVPVLGLPFDPHVSEAVATRPVEDPDQHGLVVTEILRGYRLNDRLARASRVVVGHYGAAEASQDQRPQAEAVAVASDEAPASGAAPAIDEDEAPNDDAAEEATLDEIIARAEAQQALFPSGFERSREQGKDEDIE